jgi:hypothetical protein
VHEGTDGTDLINALRTNGSLDAEPEHGQNNSADDAEIAQPESKRGAIEDREGDVKPGTDSAIQYHDNANKEVPKCDGWQRLLPTMFLHEL